MDDACQTDRIVWPPPSSAGEGEAGRRRPVNVGEFVGFDVAVRPACAGEHAKVRRYLLLDAQADAASAAIAAHERGVRRASRRLRQIERIVEPAHASAT